MRGAGRKKGSANVRTREIANKLIQEGMTPLEVMIDTMRRLVQRADDIESGAIEADQDSIKYMLEASEVASKAAPYIHPRLAAVEHSGPDGAPVQLGYIMIPTKADNG